MHANRFKISLLVCAAVAAPASHSQNVNFTPVQTPGQYGQLPNFEALAVDPSTGYFYERSGYDGGNVVSIYQSAAALAAGTPLGTVTLAGTGPYGTYIAADNGQLYGRTNSSTSATTSWSLTTGAQTGSLGGYSGMGGSDYSDTFDWGGYSGVNFMVDSTGTYVLGHTSGTPNWQIETLGNGLNAASTTSFTPIGGSSGGVLGYGFVINGTLFTGQTYDSNVVTEAVNVHTGAVSGVDFTLSGIPYLYLSDFTYDPVNNTLYAFSTENGTLYAATDASAQFGVAPVPLPAAAWFLLSGLGALGVTCRKRNSN